MAKDYFRDLLVDNIKDSKMIICGIPFDNNASVGKGASMAPDNFRKLSAYLPALSMDGYDISSYKIFDAGNIEYHNESVEDYFSKIYNKASNIYKNEKFTCFFGGDHSVAIPTEQAFYDYAKSINKIPVIIHIDAHPDICDVYENSKYSHACPNRRSLEYGYKNENMVLIGIRGYELQETIFFSKNKDIDVYNASYINEHGINKMLENIINKYDDRHVIYLSYDIDANDPCFAPGTGTPEAFGLKNTDTLKIITTLIDKLNVKAMDFVEVAPPLDVNDITSWLALKTLYEVILTKENKDAKTHNA